MLAFLCCTDRNDPADIDEAMRAKAATKIQAQQRGKIGRRDAAQRKGEIDAYKAAAGVDNGQPAEDLGDGIADAPPTQTRLLQVEILSAKALRNCIRGFVSSKKSSPFVRGFIGGCDFETQIVSSSLNPAWNETFEIADYQAGTDIRLEVYHPAVKKTSEILLGKVTIPGDSIGEGIDATAYSLTDTGLKKSTSTLTVKVGWAAMRTDKRISAFKDSAIETWIVRYRAIGLRRGPGIAEPRVNIDLQPGEEFGVIELVEGAGGQEYLRLADGRGWAFTRSAKDNELLCERLEKKEAPEIEDEGAMDAGAEGDMEATKTITSGDGDMDASKTITSGDGGDGEPSAEPSPQEENI
eukprot:TRINITY_DN1401_c0_g1_i1.p1 TRINITY_DN1401_c0_g1~~TRINITY_DN1401_c0_g1_i1.p1  ORF type:complete len:353 (+),score=125.65 TRINITY_DN1401_c0_g1_i1:88-1146(+)